MKTKYVNPADCNWNRAAPGTDRFITRQATGIILTTLLLSPLSSVPAQTPDDAFESYLIDICDGPDDQALIQLCIDTGLLGGGSGGPGGTISANNLGVLGAQGRTATTAANWQIKGVEERLRALKEDEQKKKGGGASSEQRFGRWSMFASARYADADRPTTDLETGYEADLGGITLGADFRLTDRSVIGLALGYAETEVDYDGSAGNLDLRSFDMTLYGNLNPIENTFIDLYLGYASLDYDSKRNVSFGMISGVAKGSPDGDQFLAGFSAGYDWNFNALTISPTVSLDYVKSSIDGYSETGGTGLELSYEAQDVYSLTTSMGAQASYATATSWGVLIPQARLKYVHEHKNDSRSIASTLLLSPTDVFTNNTGETDRNYFIAGIGLSTVLRNGLQAFLDFEQLLSHDLLDTWTITGGFRKEF